MNADALARYGLVPKRPSALDSSALKDFADCPSLYYLRHVLGLKLKSRDPQDDAKFDYGTVWHRVQHRWHDTKSQVEALKAVEPWPSSIMAESDKHGRSKQRLIKSFFDYAEKYKDDDLDYEDLRSEQYFEVYDSEYDIKWSGIIDRIKRRKRNKKIVIWDFKTTSNMGVHFFDQYEFSFQLPGYIWASSQFLTEPADELVLDVLYTLKSKVEYFRRTIRYSPATIAEWRRNTKLVLDRLYYMLDNHLYDPEAWHKNWNQCTRYGICQFSRVHFATPEGDSRLVTLMNDYVEDRWDPSNRDSEEAI